MCERSIFNAKEKSTMAITEVKDVFAKMPEVFSPSGAQGVDAVFQFDIKGERGGSWHVTVKDGACQVSEGSHENPNVTLTLSDENWLAMINRELNGVQAFLTGKLKVSGDIMLAQRIYDIFPF
jgi:putative sterol carrier protein